VLVVGLNFQPELIFGRLLRLAALLLMLHCRLVMAVPANSETLGRRKWMKDLVSDQCFGAKRSMIFCLMP
jgi:hypothetical protein